MPNPAAMSPVAFFRSACVLLLLAAAARASSVSGVVVTNQPTAPYYVIEADAVDGNGFSNRHLLEMEAQVSLTLAGTYELRWSLIDETDTAVHTDSSQTMSGPTVGAVTRSISFDLPAGVTLDQNKVYRAKLAVFRDLGFGAYMATASDVETTGRTYLHFTSTNPTDLDRNVITEVVSGSYSRTYLLEADSSLDAVPLSVTIRLHRYDAWGSAVGTASVNTKVEAKLHEVGTDAETTPTAGVSSVIAVDIDSHDGGIFMKSPVVVNQVHTLEVDPPVQLESFSKTYYAKAMSFDQGIAALGYQQGEAQNLANQRLRHYSGALEWGNIATHFTSFSAGPVGVTLGANYVQSGSVGVTGGSVDSPAGYSFSASGLTLRLFDDGHAEVFAGTANVSGPVPDTGTAGGLGFARSGIVLSSTGGTASFEVTLPVGMGYSSTRDQWLLDNELDITGVTLSSALAPTGNPVRAGTLWFAEETKPVRCEVSDVTWHVSTGTFDFTEVSAYAVRKPFDTELAATVGLKNASMTTKRSNDNYYHDLDGTLTAMTLSKGATNGDARLTAQFGVAVGDFRTHFPYDVELKWNAAGTLKFTNDLVTPASSTLASGVAVSVAYAQHCWDAGDCGLGTRFDSMNITPDGGTLSFTADGGLHAKDRSTHAVGGNALAWGMFAATPQFAHSHVLSFTDGNFLMAGTFLRGDSVSTTSAADKPGVLHHSGFDPANLSNAERPADVGYLTGAADYPGLNLRAQPLMPAMSLIAGEAMGYDMKTRSKYYLRHGGVSGIHDPDPASVADTATLYGYDFTISTMGLSFLGGENVISRFNGSIDLPQYSDFSIGFENLTLTCLGGLDGGEVPATETDKTLQHWNAIMTPLSIAFERASECDPGTGFLTIGMQGHASHLDFPLAGTLGFLSTGALIREADAKPSAADPITSRFPLPASFTLTGRQGSDYTFTPVQQAYLSHHTRTSSGQGLWNLFGTINVPFFEDIQAHLQVKAVEADTTSALPIMGGWPAHGWKIATTQTPFNTTAFDTSHDSFTGSTLTDYQNGGAGASAQAYLPRAQRSWLGGIVEFDYPLNWDTTLRYFTAASPTVNANLLVLQAQHQLDYLGPDTADISFGIQYDGLPSISIGNLLVNELGDSTGMAQAVVEAAGDDVFAALEDGLDDFSDLVSDKAEDLTDQILDAAIDTPLDLFFNELKSELQNPAATAYADADALIDAWFGATGAPGPVPAFVLRSQLAAMNGGASAINLLSEVDRKLAKVQGLINAFIGEVPRSGGVDPGILFEDALGNRTVFQSLGSEIIETLADLTVTPTLTTELNNLLAEAEPALETITSTLTSLNTQITALRTQISSATDLAAEINALFAANAALFQTIADDSAAEMKLILAEVAQQDYAQFDSLKAELKQRIRAHIADALNTSTLITDIRNALRDRLNDLHRSFESAVDSVFAEINKAIRDVVTESLAGVDDNINGLLGDLGDKMGAGSINGFASINNDSLDMLRLDGHFEWEMAAEKQQFDAYLEILNLETNGPAGCSTTAADTYQVTLGAPNTKLTWRGVDLQVGLEGKFNLNVASTPFPSGVGGSFELKSGSLDFEGMGVEELYVTTMLSVGGSGGGVEEAYIGGAASLTFSGSGIAGGLFLGRTCTIDPILEIDPDVGSVLGTPPFTGGYVYGEGTWPLVDFGCVFNISASAGTGIFYFAEGPTYGGKIHAGVSGEALCVISVKGEIDLVGVKSGDDFRFTGAGKVKGKVGACPFCKRFNKTVRLTYENGGWDADY